MNTKDSKALSGARCDHNQHLLLPLTTCPGGWRLGGGDCGTTTSTSRVHTLHCAGTSRPYGALQIGQRFCSDFERDCFCRFCNGFNSSAKTVGGLSHSERMPEERDQPADFTRCSVGSGGNVVAQGLSLSGRQSVVEFAACSAARDRARFLSAKSLTEIACIVCFFHRQ